MFRIAWSLGAPKRPLDDAQIRLNAHRLVGAHSESEGMAQSDPALDSHEGVECHARPDLLRDARDAREVEKVQEIH